MIDWQTIYVEFVGELPHNAQVGQELAEGGRPYVGKVVVEGFYPIPPNPQGYVRKKILRVTAAPVIVRQTTAQGDGNCYRDSEGVYRTLRWTPYWVEEANPRASFGPEWDDWSGWHQD